MQQDTVCIPETKGTVPAKPSADSQASLIDNGVLTKHEAAAPPALKVALLTGGFDRPYAFGLAMSLVAGNVHLDVIGSDSVDSPEMHSTPNLRFLNLWPSKRPRSSRLRSVWSMIRHYF